MPLIIDQDEAKAHMNAWLTALPSQVNDSFYQLYQPSDNTPSSLRRVVAFEVDQEDMKKFANLVYPLRLRLKASYHEGCWMN